MFWKQYINNIYVAKFKTGCSFCCSVQIFIIINNKQQIESVFFFMKRISFCTTIIHPYQTQILYFQKGLFEHSKINMQSGDSNRDLFYICNVIWKQYVINGGKLGMKVGSKETDMVFLRKPQTKSIMKFLKMGKTTFDIVGRLNCSPKTITKCRKMMKEELVWV